MTGQLIAAREPLAATRECASVGLLAGVSANVPGLVLQAVEGLITQRALVGARQLVRALGLLGAWQRAVRLDVGHSSGSHVAGFSLLLRGRVVDGVVVEKPRYVDGGL